ncbi:hypothetical protein F4806DRAFT_21153 [Annulohypoxylon nitens]|nr:hypothetical protein F4806DRAFT_21153 [Annulohypoxylon nitens]
MIHHSTYTNYYKLLLSASASMLVLLQGVLMGLTQFVATGIANGSFRQAAVGYHVAYLEETIPELVIIVLKYLVAISTSYFATIWPSNLAICSSYRRLFPQPIVLVVLLRYRRHLPLYEYREPGCGSSCLPAV